MVQTFNELSFKPWLNATKKLFLLDTQPETTAGVMIAVAANSARVSASDKQMLTPLETWNPYRKGGFLHIV